MNRKPMKIRAQRKNSSTIVKVLIYHPMETGLRKDINSKKLVPAHYIQELTCKHNDETKVVMGLGVSVSKNPFFQFELEGGAAGDTIEVAWLDNKGETGSAIAQVK